ncbi:hypothetical protein PoB_005914400 [Plakobranchus ocellatus]|uniref:Uncharacterized protein n=1 Tax=Plakobranchus ocellatus TaxID=259542 RepID=A0AAV4CMZ9_9GAST|nr:hypothetical protein PoB_005914400 [Plakobranchus ocellatus]
MNRSSEKTGPKRRGNQLHSSKNRPFLCASLGEALSTRPQKAPKVILSWDHIALRDAMNRVCSARGKNVIASQVRSKHNACPQDGIPGSYYTNQHQTS